MKKEMEVDAAFDLNFIFAVAEDASEEGVKEHSEMFTSWMEENMPDTKFEKGKQSIAMLLILWISLMKVEGDEDDELIPFIHAMIMHKDTQGPVHLIAIHLFTGTQSVSKLGRKLEMLVVSFVMFADSSCISAFLQFSLMFSI
jgi:hypothetical protein